MPFVMRVPPSRHLNANLMITPVLSVSCQDGHPISNASLTDVYPYG